MALLSMQPLVKDMQNLPRLDALSGLGRRANQLPRRLCGPQRCRIFIDFSSISSIAPEEFGRMPVVRLHILRVKLDRPGAVQ
jgi:hypothetical protein